MENSNNEDINYFFTCIIVLATAIYVMVEALQLLY